MWEFLTQFTTHIGAYSKQAERLSVDFNQNFQSGINRGNASRFAIRFVVAFCVLFGGLFSVVLPDIANAQSRSLKLYYLHTGERATITYKRNGKFLSGGLKKMNYFLRDWRRNEPTRMDPNLLDLIWEVYRQSGSRKAIHVISGYRSPTTNNMLRKRGRGVAKKSLHTLGKAMDFFLPDVKLGKLRKIGLVKQVGGVGYYPRSGSPFVHMDTGRVRHWPRMTRKQLVQVFPKGKTLHIPTDGKPLTGYKQAVASYNARKSSTKKIPIAKGTEKEKLNFFQRLARIGSEDKEDNSPVTAPKPRAVKTTKSPVVATSAQSLKPQTGKPQTGKPEKLPTETPPVEKAEPDKPAIPALASIPVPLNAPRNGGETVLAQLETQQAETLVSETTLASDGAPDGSLPLDDNQPLNPGEELAPIPARRPKYQSIFVAENTPQIEPVSAPVSAFAPTVQLASLTADKLRNDLRSQARAQLRSALGTAPRPGADVGKRFETALVQPIVQSSSNALPLTRSFIAAEPELVLQPIDKSLKTGGTTPWPLSRPPAVEPEQTVESSIIVASLRPAATKASENSLRERLLREALTRDALKRELEAQKADAPEPLDDNQISTGNAPAPVRNPNSAVQTATLKIDPLGSNPFGSDPLDSELNNSGLIPAPSRNPVQIQVASLDAPIAAFGPVPLRRPNVEARKFVPNSNSKKIAAPNTVAAVPANVQTASLRAINNAAPAALDNLLVEWKGHKIAGKYVLNSTSTIKGIDDLRAPAYGRAAIRQAPRTVLTDGFSRAGGVQIAGKFTGKAVQFLAFSKFE